ncbi:bacillithiol biosynthesis cysteine-adding enzyme BshC [Pedobacter nutrimenti]|uniref:Putative cysteine ligase BshC n=1 Tax=Pedobacter nutrimenti TaxID=1241337 RepID=A0A318UHH5_9SPHI|nr:bacillithiol biosynthesis cysteine-adding enzyme BshC [Pedobacter nutrimenti]PYF74478.1 bacillithiol biosynthesis cysteine-adding enzyme BshC [Pedobacter nutrimenti]
MLAKYISYQDTHSFSSVVLDYVEGKRVLDPFYSFRPDLNGFEQALNSRKMIGDRTVLLQALEKQYAGMVLSNPLKTNLGLLAEEKTFTITTGHQLNIFTGPLYFIYKIVTAINLARELKQQFPDCNFVPVYWMATEDHDFEEINHLRVEDKMLTWKKQASGATGRLNPKDITEVLQAYKGYLGISENGKKLSELVDRAYSNHSNLSAATRELVNGLFGNEGLICIDADDRALKQQFAAIIAADVTQQHSFREISRSNQALENAGYKAQVNPREVNFFYMTDQLRERIIYENDTYKVLNTALTFTQEELMQEIKDYPERFSPNVVMRPLYQEVILPNLAYIGGGAEVTYWLQLKSNFDHYHVPYPVLMLRNSALVIDAQSARKMHILGISHQSLFQSNETLKNEWIKSHVHNLALSLEDERRSVSAIFDHIKLDAFKIDKTLSPSTDAAKTRTLKLIDNLEKKMLRAEKRKHATSLNQIDALKNKLFPSGVLQERVVNIAPMYVLYGDDFIQSLLKSFKPLDHQFTVFFA